MDGLGKGIFYDENGPIGSQPEDRLRKYTFNVEGKIYDFSVSDRALVKALQTHDRLVEALKVAIDDHGFEYLLNGDPKEWKKLVDEAEGK